MRRVKKLSITFLQIDSWHSSKAEKAVFRVS